ncbi:MAG: phenylalanine--tRNA ligase subunit alpha [Clostridia bacterium]|nr:phenylalanine--tRNA ligase subunit alpha [Clostridia bacterium]MBQ4451729.1 phenylalanine--tRNA ligase subunit alpha [Clostridia bacterium]MBR5379601.1 phenylalanine--tRNA ligase subunit alpha [Clostridia bacterium]MBR5751348.1 phenylalanine--tRNA ligase subunit alpha [Clostridia bacterium]
MQQIINKICERALSELKGVSDSKSLDELRVRILGKKGELTGILRSMGQVSAELRPKIGQWVNEARETIENALAEAQKQIARRELEQRLESEKLDVTLPVQDRSEGSLHPMSLVLETLLDIFTGMGFEAVEGPEVEYDHFNFELMNIPKNHPARDAQDTFYVDDNIVLRTHTSPVQARIMTTRKPPIRIVSFGRVYRADEADATHSPVFHQLEGLVIDENVSMGDLKGTLDTFAKRLYGEGVTTRFRPSFFPFTEPSAEVDLTCAACRGKGCRVCKGTGWIEVLGAGMVNPKVLEMCGIDSKKYSGFAFGMGVERLTNLKYNVPDMRYLYENDMRFLKQFRG